MLITKSELIEMNACENGLERFIEQTGGTEDPIDATTLVGGVNTYSDLLWLAREKIPKDRIIRFACDCALLRVELIKPCTTEYEMIVDVLKNPYDTDEASVSSAFKAARAAARSAASTAARANVSGGAMVTAARATVAAIHTACNTSFSVDGSAASAAASASYKSYKDSPVGNTDKVNRLLIEMFNEY